METLAAQNELMAFRHDGFWKPMDTLRDKTELENRLDPPAMPSGKCGENEFNV